MLNNFLGLDIIQIEQIAQGESITLSEEIRSDLHERLNRAVDIGILSKNGTIFKSRVNFFRPVPQNIKSLLQGQDQIECDYIS